MPTGAKIKPKSVHKEQILASHGKGGKYLRREGVKEKWLLDRYTYSPCLYPLAMQARVLLYPLTMQGSANTDF
jgi:hypothetical protein